MPCLGQSPGGGVGSPLGAVVWLGPCPSLGLHAALSTPAWGWDEQAAQTAIHPALHTSRWPLFFHTVLAAGLGRPVAGCTPLPFPEGVLYSTVPPLPQPRARCFPQGEFLLPAGAVGTTMNGCSLAGGSRRAQMRDNSQGWLGCS